MTGALDFATLAALAGNKSPADVPCPLCSPNCTTKAGRQKRVLRIWRETPGFTRFNCARCGEKGYAHDGTAPRRPTTVRPVAPDIDQVSARAMRLWRRARPADSDHPYLVAKRVRPHGIGQIDDCLVIPVQRPAQLVGLQFISPDGAKRFLKGTVKKGAYHILGDPALQPTGRIAFAEGYATAATIYEAVGTPTVVAFDAGNMLPVAERLRRIFPAAEFIFAADEDEAGERGCRDAALAAGGLVMRAA